MIPAIVVALLAAGAAMPAHAEKADRTKPLNIEADRLQYDDVKQISVFTGNVTLTKGTLLLKADRLVVRQDAQGYQYGTAYGNPAKFRQRRDVPDQYVEGYGNEVDYNGKSEVVTFRQNALLKRLDKDKVTDEIQGSLIVYDSVSEFMNVESGSRATAPGTNPGGRVRVVIQPKAGADQPPGPDPAPARLRPDPGPANPETPRPAR